MESLLKLRIITLKSQKSSCNLAIMAHSTLAVDQKSYKAEPDKLSKFLNTQTPEGFNEYWEKQENK